MGRDTGFIALSAGLAVGAESILIPEEPFSIQHVCDKLRRGQRRGKQHSIIVVAEGAASGVEIGQLVKDHSGLDTKVAILGHVQRGGTPTAFDRILASRLGTHAVHLLMSGSTSRMVGMVDGQIVDSTLNRLRPGKSPSIGICTVWPPFCQYREHSRQYTFLIGPRRASLLDGPSFL